MHPNDSLDSDEDEIIVLEIVIVDTPNNSAEVVNPRVIKDQKSNFECEEGNERFKIVRRGAAADTVVATMTFTSENPQYLLQMLL